MRCKVVHLTRAKSGRASRRETIVEVGDGKVGFGRGTENSVQLDDLRIPYHAAHLVLRDQGPIIEAPDESLLRIDGIPCRRWLLAAESDFELGPYKIALKPRSASADLTVEVELVVPPPQETGKLLVPGRTRIEGRILGKRRLSWALFLAALVVGLILPLYAFLTPKPSLVAMVEGRPGDAAAVQVPGTLATFDRWWTSGPLSDGHKFLSERCDACHTAPFQLVRAKVCVDCHPATRHHFDPTKFTFAKLQDSSGSFIERHTRLIEDYSATGCTSCHGEHLSTASALPLSESLCKDCHGDLDKHPGKTALLNVTGFAPLTHPEFRPSIVVDPASPQGIQRVTLGASDFPKESSGIKFPHDIHLSRRQCPPSAEELARADEEGKKKIRGECSIATVARTMHANGKIEQDHLACSDCHRPEPGGAFMEPVRMEASCAFAGCHDLTFDKGPPPRLLPHGQPDDVIAVIKDWRLARAARNQPVLVPPADLRRLPGAARQPQPQAQPAAPRVDQAKLAEEAADAEVEAVFKEKLCGECHAIKSPKESVSKRWEVQPVRLQTVWLPKSRFHHGQHEAMSCNECHGAALTSRTSADVLMPKIEVCFRCHQESATTVAVPSPCTMCHDYHDRDRHRQGDRPPLAAMTATP